MTVDQQGTDEYDRVRVWTVWFNITGDLRTATFPPEALERVEEGVAPAGRQ